MDFKIIAEKNINGSEKLIKNAETEKSSFKYDPCEVLSGGYVVIDFGERKS